MRDRNYFGALAQQQRNATMQGVMGAERGKNSETTPVERDRKINRENGQSIISLVKKEMAHETYSASAEKVRDLARLRYEDDDLPEEEEERGEIASYIASGLSKHNATFFDNGAAFGQIGEVVFDSDRDNPKRVLFSDEQIHAAAVLEGDTLKAEISDGGQALRRRYGNYSYSYLIHYDSDTMPNKSFTMNRVVGLTNDRGAFETFTVEQPAHSTASTHNTIYDKIEAFIDDIVSHNPEYEKTSDVSFSRYGIDPASLDGQPVRLPKGFDDTGLTAKQPDFAELSEQLKKFESQVKDIYDFTQRVNSQITNHFSQ